jgi:hypothetical protein
MWRGEAAVAMQALQWEKRVNEGLLDALQYSSDSSLVSKTSITPCGARGLREVMDMQRVQDY